jgi:hypothetical protein
MVDAIIHYSAIARNKVLQINPIEVRDAFMEKIRKWITETSALVADNPAVDRTRATIKVVLERRKRRVTITWNYDAAQKKIYRDG